MFYQSPSVLIIGRTDEDDPLFGDLVDILYFDDFIFFYVEVLEYVTFSHHFHAHIVSTDHNSLKYLILYDNLIDHSPYGLYLPPSFSPIHPYRFIVPKCIFF